MLNTQVEVNKCTREGSRCEMVGLDIKIKNEYSNYLYKIFDRIDLSKYIWKINTEDFLYTDNGSTKQNFFGADILSGEEFYRCISRDSYYMIFADIKAYPIGSTQTEIKTFGDFWESDCEIVFLCTDSTFVELYSKDRSILDRVYNNCKTNGFEDVKCRSFMDASERNLVAW